MRDQQCVTAINIISYRELIFPAASFIFVHSFPHGIEKDVSTQYVTLLYHKLVMTFNWRIQNGSSRLSKSFWVGLANMDLLPNT